MQRSLTNQNSIKTKMTRVH